MRRLLLGFLLGSIPFGLLLTRVAGLGDIRAIGSGNIGATNVLRTGRRDLAAATLLLDALKGTAAVLLARQLGGPAALAGLAAVLGHTLTPWLRFRGGKGVATGLGALFGIAWPLGLAAPCWLPPPRSPASPRSPRCRLRRGAADRASSCHALPWPIPLIAAWIVWRHRANIARLRAGTEPRIGAVTQAERLARIRLARTAGVGPLTYRRLLARFAVPRRRIDALPGLARAGGRTAPVAVTPPRRRARTGPAAPARRPHAGARRARTTPRCWPCWRTRRPCISILGDPALLGPRAVGLVGARNASANGQRMAEALAAELASHDVLVVSGLARGIDTAAHTGAMHTGRTVAAIAGGLDMPYPPENAALQARIAERASWSPRRRSAPRRRPALPAAQPHHRRAVAGRGGGGGGAAFRQPDHRAAGAGRAPRGAGGAGLAAGPALPRLQRPDPRRRHPGRPGRRRAGGAGRMARPPGPLPLGFAEPARRWTAPADRGDGRAPRCWRCSAPTRRRLTI